MISIVSNGQLEEIQQNNSLKNDCSTQSQNTKKKVQIRKKILIIFLIVIFVIILITILIAGIVYGVLINNNNIKIDNSKVQVKDARGWFNSDTPNCGIQHFMPFMPNARIVNGYESNPNSWPWVVSIGYAGPNLNLPHACGGVLINKRFVVTATHCVKSDQVYSLIGKPRFDDIRYSSLERMLRIYIGVHDRQQDISMRNTYYAFKVISFPNFDENTFENDISLIQLDRDVELSNTVNTICLNSQGFLRPGENVIAVGWGFTTGSAKKASRYLMQVSLSVQSESKCEISYLKNSQFCAGNTFPKRDTCNGDSGGPVMKLIENRWTLVGIVSNGDADCDGVGVYTVVPLYYNWLMKNAQL